ncbi:hypothetical protein QBC43DRAFT_306441 [Cladorrhinum sp. PSN259]|nr:hypothetical protein QBC43DRAFT_306441 [Cladorrhinum sp. PSN259]
MGRQRSFFVFFFLYGQAKTRRGYVCWFGLVRFGSLSLSLDSFLRPLFFLKEPILYPTFYFILILFLISFYQASGLLVFILVSFKG